MNWTKTLGLLILQLVIGFYANSQKSDNEYLGSVQAIKKRGYSVEACYRMAEDFLRSNSEQNKAIPYLNYILEADPQASPEVIYMLAQAYYYDGQFNLAVDKLNEYIDKEKNGKLKKDAKNELEKYENTRRLANSPLNVSLINLGPKINTKYAEINPFVSKYENLLVYSSKRGKDYDIYVSKKGKYDVLWGKSKLAGNYVNTINDEFVAGLSTTGTNLFIHYNQVSGFEDINISKRFKGLYRELEDPGSKINTTYREEGACFSKNKDTLFFASDRPGGFGGFDIYYSLKLPEGSWGPPLNMGNIINTTLDENYPNISPDGNRLYFSSQGHNSIGGFDIFYTTYDVASSSWTQPVNFGYPINNAYDNKNIAFTENSRYAYISTIDNNSYGDFDIYKVIFNDVEPEFLIIRAKVFIKDVDGQIPYDQEGSLTLTALKGDETFGMYSFDKRNNCFILALVPGEYVLEIQSEKYEVYRSKINIRENYYRNKHRLLKITLTPKEN